MLTQVTYTPLVGGQGEVMKVIKVNVFQKVESLHAQHPLVGPWVRAKSVHAPVLVVSREGHLRRRAARAAGGGRGRECVCADSGRGVAGVYISTIAAVPSQASRRTRTFSKNVLQAHGFRETTKNVPGAHAQ